MSRAAAPATATGALFRASPWDGFLVGLAVLQGALLAVATARADASPRALPVALLVALGLWWNSNTISHNHLHGPFFRSRRLSRAFSLYLTALLGVPQSIWRERHLWHHAGEPARPPRPLGREAVVELALVGAVWLGLALWRPGGFFAAYLPGYLLGLALCQAQGHYEHADVGPGGVSCYGRLHNLLWFNDGGIL